MEERIVAKLLHEGAGLAGKWASIGAGTGTDLFGLTLRLTALRSSSLVWSSCSYVGSGRYQTTGRGKEPPMTFSQ